MIRHQFQLTNRLCSLCCLVYSPWLSPKLSMTSTGPPPLTPRKSFTPAPPPIHTNPTCTAPVQSQPRKTRDGLCFLLEADLYGLLKMIGKP
jgi:hypothetical protein